jgi:osmotically-inducible protein OsmY
MKAALAMNCAIMIGGAASGCFGEAHPQHETGSFLDDKVTKARVEAALHQGTSNTLREVQVAVTNGTAHLTGTVPTNAQRDEAGRLAKTVHRVRRVDNDIQVEH